MAENEKTRAEIATMAGQFLSMDPMARIRFAVNNPLDLASIVASALTQAADKPAPPARVDERNRHRGRGR